MFPSFEKETTTNYLSLIFISYHSVTYSNNHNARCHGQHFRSNNFI